MSWRLPFRSWSEAPRLVGRFYQRWRLAQLALLAAVVVAILLDLPSSIGLTMTLIAFGVIGATLPVSFYIAAQWEKRLMKQLEEAAYRLCPECGHPLTGLDGTIACPECGTPCEVEHVESTWRAFRPIMLGPFQ